MCKPKISCNKIINSKDLKLFKKGVIPHLMRDLQSLIWSGDIASRAKDERIRV